MLGGSYNRPQGEMGRYSSSMIRLMVSKHNKFDYKIHFYKKSTQFLLNSLTDAIDKIVGGLLVCI